MSTATADRPGKAKREHYELEVNSYDRASSLLIALLVMVVVTLAALVIIFFARRFVDIPVAVPVMPLDPAERPAEAAMGLKQDIEPPGIEDAPELSEPKLMDTLNALTSTMASKVAILSDENLDADTEVGKGSGFGDNRTSGGGGGAPEPRREFKYEFADIATYAKWYDFYKIELAALDQTAASVAYASNLSNAKPSVREAPRAEENRYAIVCGQGDLYRYDLQLAEKAGIASRGDYLLQMFPNELYVQLLGLEQAQAKKAGKKIDEIERTIFNFESRGAGFSVAIQEQLYY